MTNDADFLPVVGPSKDERTWAMLCHLCIVGQMFFFPLVIAPLLIWLIKGDEMPLVKQQGKEAVNFQITLLLAAVVCGILWFVVIGILLGAALWLYAVIAGIIATMKVKEGFAYRYPFCLRLIS
jgi:uncharacterized protein